MRWEYKLQNVQRRGNLLRSERWLRSRWKRGRRRGSAFLSPTSRFSTSTSEIFMILTPRLGYITLLVFRGSLTATCEICVQALRLPLPFVFPLLPFVWYPKYTVMIRFQLILPVANHNVTKNLTGHRMHVEGPQIYQMNCQINSFQNMCDTLKAKINSLARKIDSLQKHVKIGYFCVHFSGLPDFGRPWTANGWQQVNFGPTPENLGVWRFKLAV